MTDQVTIYIDDQEVTVPAGMLVVDAAKLVENAIPVFCYHPKMAPVGMCRMCLVEIGRPAFDRATREPILNEDGKQKIAYGPKLETACTVPVSPNMHVRTATKKVADARQDIIEFLLTSHPLDCPICDKGGECPLQNLTMRHGSDSSRFVFSEKMKFDKHVPLGDLIYLDRERCIQCARCTRFCDEIAEDRVLGFFQRGRSLEIVTHSDPGFDSYWSGNTTDICPVGALTTADFRFNARPWELKQAASLCTQCAVGCNTTINFRRDGLSGNFELKRIMPRQNEQVNEIWLCDKGRFGHAYAHGSNRLHTPLIRKAGRLVEASWEDALALAAEKLSAANGAVAGLISDRLPNEDLFMFKTLIDKLDGRVAQATGSMGGGGLVQQVGVGVGSNLGDLGSGSTIVVVACDLEEEAPVWWLRVKQAAELRGATLLVANARDTKIDAHAAETIRYTYGAEVATIDKLAKHKAVTEAENLVVLYGSDGLDLVSSSAVAQACANLLIATGHYGRPNNGLIAVWPHNNTQGAWDMGIRPASPSVTEFLSEAKVIFLAGANPVADGHKMPATAFIIASELTSTASVEYANVVFPAQAFTEREGTFTNGERRVQRFYPALPHTGESHPDWLIFSHIGTRLNLLKKLPLSAAGVFSDIAHTVPAYAGLTYRMLAQVEEQYPVVGGSDLYYGGTSYKNTGGLGVQVPTTTEQGQQVEQAKVDVPKPQRVKGLLAAATTTLYDRGVIFGRSRLMQRRIPDAHVEVNLADGKRLGINDGDKVEITIGEQTVQLMARVNGRAPQGVILVPQSLGGPILRGTAPANLRKLEPATA